MSSASVRIGVSFPKSRFKYSPEHEVTSMETPMVVVSEASEIFVVMAEVAKEVSVVLPEA